MANNSENNRKPESQRTFGDAGREETRSGKDRDRRYTDPDAEAYKGEADNVRNDSTQTLSEEELQHSRNKSTEGIRQNRDTSDSGNNDKVTT